jgi:hypothetical protein
MVFNIQGEACSAYQELGGGRVAYTAQANPESVTKTETWQATASVNRSATLGSTLSVEVGFETAAKAGGGVSIPGLANGNVEVSTKFSSKFGASINASMTRGSGESYSDTDSTSIVIKPPVAQYNSCGSISKRTETQLYVGKRQYVADLVRTCELEPIEVTRGLSAKTATFAGKNLSMPMAKRLNGGGTLEFEISAYSPMEEDPCPARLCETSKMSDADKTYQDEACRGKPKHYGRLAGLCLTKFDQGALEEYGGKGETREGDDTGAAEVGAAGAADENADTDAQPDGRE